MNHHRCTRKLVVNEACVPSVKGVKVKGQCGFVTPHACTRGKVIGLLSSSARNRQISTSRHVCVL